jgi:glycine betaine/proline transport system ATP-binding protein
MFITHDFDEALKLADRIAIMKDGIIEQLDTPANIVLNPATEYVKKFTEEVPRELSGGQQQRVGIARSLAVEPDIWFLDEPFSALDPLIRKEMQDEFLRLQGKLQKTIMFITHDFDEALKLADRIAIMKDGIIEQLDTPANIVLNPATEYVRKFTEEVPREKVLKIEDIMEKPHNENLSDLKVLKSEIIENVAEKILTQEKSVGVFDENNQIVGTVHPSKIINTVFGGKKNSD